MKNLSSILFVCSLVALSLTKNHHHHHQNSTKHFLAPSTAAQEPFPVVPRKMSIKSVSTDGAGRNTFGDRVFKLDLDG